MNKLLFLFGFSLCLINQSLAQFGDFPQEKLNTFNSEKVKISRGGMFALSGWAVANFAVSGAGWANGSGSNKYFHMGNVLWNVVNVGLAVPGLIGSYKKSKDLNFYQTMRQQSGVEKVFLVNAGIDVGYVAAAFYLRELAKNNSGDRAHQFEGFGNSLLLQGGFLLVFDTGMFLAHHLHAKNKLYKFADGLTFYGTGFHYRYTF
jgi:hypothetical protein